MTSEVMATVTTPPHLGGQEEIMQSNSTQSTQSTRSTALAAGGVLTVFFAFSSWVIAQEGYFGFLTLAAREPWGAQILIDLALALVFVTGWLIRDARARGMNPWPYVIATPFVGTMAPLLYLVVRGLKERNAAGHDAVAEHDAAPSEVPAE